MILRTKYLDQIIPHINQSLIKIIIGVHRSGKTVLLDQIRHHILDNGVSESQTIVINFEFNTTRKLQDEDVLYDFVMQKAKEQQGKRLYLFFDEMQVVPQWQKIVNSFAVDVDCDIYLTISNSNFLNSALATCIAGRYIHFILYPLTFSESLGFYCQQAVKNPTEELFEDYLKYGGLPPRYLLSDESSVQTYLDDVLTAIVFKDTLARDKKIDINLLQRLVAFLLDNVGTPFSANSICNKLKSEGIKTTVATLMNYISAIKNAMVLIPAPRYDLKGKSLLSTNEKYYATDLGLRNNVKSSDVIDYNKLYENVVFLEMLSRGYEIMVGKLGEYEVDFICIKNRQKVYIQVAYLLSDSSVVEREFRPLLKIEDNFPKYVISGDRHDFSGNGIIHKNIVDFLLDKDKIEENDI